MMIDKKDLEYQLKKLHIGPGDHLVIATKERSNVDGWADVLRPYLPENTIIFFVDELEDINTIDEERLAVYGWVRNAH